MSNFHPLEVVGRGSGTQLQAGENLNKYNLAGKGLSLFMQGFFKDSLFLVILAGNCVRIAS